MSVELENVEGVELKANYKEGHSQQNGSLPLRKRKSSLSNKVKTDLDQKSNDLSPQNSDPIREHVHQENRHSQHLVTYNSLLKAGR